VSPLIERKQTHVETDASHFVETEKMYIHGQVSDVNFTVTGFVFMPVTKVPCGPRETTISRDR
jgi:hypothetical protein